MAYNKFGNIKTVVFGIRFDSKAEAHRYIELRDWQNKGKIADLELQPVFQLCGLNGTPVCKYIADFRYYDLAAEKVIVEDVKGHRDAFYSLKAKLFLDNFGFPILEVKA